MNRDSAVIEIEITLGVVFPRIELDCGYNVTQIATTHITQYHLIQTYSIPLLKHLHLHFSKTPNDTVLDAAGQIVRDQTVSIKNLWINNILVPPNFLARHSDYYPSYHQSFIDYCIKNNAIVNHGPLNEIKFWHAGTWRFDPILPFWDWYCCEESKQEDSKLDPDLIGYSKGHVQQQLKKLKDVIENGYAV